MLLRFGHPEDKAPVAAYLRRARQRQKLTDNVVSYFARYVPPGDWPTEYAPRCFYPKSFRRLSMTVLESAAIELQTRKRAMNPPAN